ncbi:FKBP-type peptidyl-prolyl cis-trans isomerase [Sphaerimonospora thailandensis]|uniref:FKBP-type peptidyl-prolyl cis-trans isomerase n=1 Tax=Sphaerimonospora thailandensis TaxID=795644 RepID=UPI00194EBC4A|nr:FKBP-type peptidyl-prolyl cis-trans isomerase [Sphaerimonospora thailandensis]
MRRRTAIAAATVIPLMLAAACGTAQRTTAGASPSASAAAPSGPVASADGIKVEGKVGKKPDVTFPAGNPALTSVSRRIIEGEGTPAKDGDVLAASVTVYTWDGKENKSAGSAYDQGRAEFVSVSQQLPKPLHEALVGAKPGSRTLAVIAKDVLPPQQVEEAKQQGVDFDTTNQVMVIDVESAVRKSVEGNAVDPGVKGVKVENPGGDKAPTLTTKTDAKPSDKLVVKTVIEGTGPKVEAGQTIMAHYVGKIWGSDKEFDSSWKRGEPASFSLDQVVKGWSQGLAGVPVGSRVLLTIPPDLGYGKDGNKDAGIKGTDTLVFVVDVLGAA